MGLDKIVVSFKVNIKGLTDEDIQRLCDQVRNIISDSIEVEMINVMNEESQKIIYGDGGATPRGIAGRDEIIKKCTLNSLFMGWFADLSKDVDDINQRNEIANEMRRDIAAQFDITLDANIIPPV